MKKKLLAIFLGTALVMGLAACGGGSSTTKDTNKQKTTNQTTNKTTNKTTTDTALAAEAQKITSQKCTACHGQNLQGQVGPSLQHIGSKYSKDQILGILKNGKQGGMPAGVISGSDADKVATWLSSKK